MDFITQYVTNKFQRNTTRFAKQTSNAIVSGSTTALGGTFILLNAQSVSGAPCRIRLYADSASMVTDASRASSSFALNDSVALVADIVLSGSTVLNFTPPVIGNTFTDGQLWYNLSGSSFLPITASITSYPLRLDSTTDEVVKTGRGAMGSYGTTGVQNYRRYWGESDMSKALGADDTIMKDADYDEAKKHFEDELGIEDPKELEDRLGQMGYDKKLPDDKVRLVENPKKFMEEYIESLLRKKNEDSDLVKKDEEIEEVELNPIVKKQLKSLKNSMKTYGLKPDHIMKGLKDDE